MKPSNMQATFSSSRHKDARRNFQLAASQKDLVDGPEEGMMPTRMQDGIYEEVFEMQVDGAEIDKFNQWLTQIRASLPTATLCLECTDLPWIFAQIAEDRGITYFYSKSATGLRKFSETFQSIDNFLVLTGKLVEKQAKRLGKFPELTAATVSGLEEAQLLQRILESEIERSESKKRTKVSASRDKFLDDKSSNQAPQGPTSTLKFLLRVSKSDSDKPQELLEAINSIEAQCPLLNFWGLIGDSPECTKVYHSLKAILREDKKKINKNVFVI